MRDSGRSGRSGARAGRITTVALVLLVCAIFTVPAVASAAYLQSYSFVSKFATPKPFDDSSFEPHGMAISGNGNLLVSSFDNYVSQWTTEGSQVASFGADGLTSDGPMAQCINVAVKGNDVWLMDTNVGLMKYDTNGVFSGTSIYGFQNELHASDHFDRQSGVAVDASGCVYVGDGNSNNAYMFRVLKFDSDGKWLATFGDTGAGDTWVQAPNSIVIGPHFEVYVADWEANKVMRYAPSNPARTAYKFVGYWKNTSAFYNPWGITIDAAGNLFVLDNAAGTVTKLDPSGTALAHWGGNGTTNGKFATAWSVAVNPQGRVFVDDRDGSNVQQFKSTYTGPATFANKSISVKKGKTASFSYKADADPSANVKVTIKIYKGKSLKKTISCGTVSQGYSHTKSWKDTLSKGTYTWKVYATDTAGHAQHNVASKTFTVK
jgi:sugar lactone lactonase YvrE